MCLYAWAAAHAGEKKTRAAGVAEPASKGPTPSVITDARRGPKNNGTALHRSDLWLFDFTCPFYRDLQPARTLYRLSIKSPLSCARGRYFFFFPGFLSRIVFVDFLSFSSSSSSSYDSLWGNTLEITTDHCSRLRFMGTLCSSTISRGVISRNSTTFI